MSDSESTDTVESVESPVESDISGDEEDDFQIVRQIELKKEEPVVVEPPQFVRPNVMTESQFGRFTSAVEGVAELGHRNDLTNTQFQRLTVHLRNLEETRRVVTQMIENYLDDEEISDNLFTLLDYINDGIKKQGEGGEDVLEEYRDALALSQIQDFNVREEAIAADEEFAKLLQLEFEAELVNLQAIEQEPEAKKEESEEELWNAVPENILELEELGLTVNPLETPQATIQTDNPLQQVFTSTTVEFNSWCGKPLSYIQYVECTITKKYKSFKEPFVMALWENCNEKNLQFSHELLARLSPVSIALLTNPLNLLGSSQADGINEGDTFGIGMLLQFDTITIFGTKNGKWFGHFDYSDWKVNDNVKAFQKQFKLLIITGSPFKVPQVDVSLNDGKDPEKPFVFDLKLPLEECSVCYEDVLTYCVTEVEACKHRFCRACVTNYLDVALADGKVLNTTCLDITCESELSDQVILDCIGVLKFAKFKQYRLLAKLRLEPNCRWCPNEGCDNGVVANLDSSIFPELICDKCDTSFCFHCSDIWHPNITCKKKDALKKKRANKAEVKRKQKEEKETQKWMKDNKTIKCAKCSALVQRKDGCNHMTCPCGYEFCWLCGEKIMTVIGSHSYPLHYKTGACAGKQFSNKDELSIPRKVMRTAIAPVRFGISLPLRPLQKIYEFV